MYFHGVKSTAHPPIIGALGNSTNCIVKQPNTAANNICLHSCKRIVSCWKRNSGLKQKLHLQTSKHTGRSIFKICVECLFPIFLSVLCVFVEVLMWLWQNSRRVANIQYRYNWEHLMLMLALKISSSISASLIWVSQSVSGSSSLVLPSFLPSFSVASMEHQVLCECCQCSVPISSDELILAKRRAFFGQKYGR